jgi:high-affinity Fe2+/Pb2+ permease
MEPNVGGTDRTVRVILGALALLSSMAVVVYGGGLTGGLQVVVAGALLVFAAVMFATVGARRCPVNAALGRNSCRERR